MHTTHFSEFEQRILATILYFDIFDYPMTSMEIFRYGMLSPTTTLQQVHSVCQRLCDEHILICRHGFYVLPDRTTLLATRHHRHIVSLHKYALARKATRWLRWLPGIRMIGVCNNLGIRNTKQHSDIDFFITTQRDRLWLVRLGAIVVTSMLHIRLAGSEKANKVCLSFYCQSDTSIESIALAKGDPYLIWWLATLRPLYHQKAYDDFITSNKWFQEYVPQWRPAVVVHRFLVRTGWEAQWKRLWEYCLNSPLGSWLERLVHRWQEQRLITAITDLAHSSSTSVVIDKSMLKLHTNDRRGLYRDQWRQQCVNYGLDTTLWH